MRILVTGANGFIGSHLCEYLLKKEFTVRCLVRETSNLEWIYRLPVEYVNGHLGEMDVLRRAVEDVDYVFHGAAITRAKTPELYHQINTKGAENVFQACYEVRSNIKRCVFVSSQAAAGPSPTKNPIDESQPCQPITDYGKSKYEAEKIAHQFVPHFPLTIIRPPAVYGPRDKDVLFFFKLVKWGIMPKFQEAEQYISLSYVKDLVEGMYLAARSPNTIGETYFLAHEEIYSWLEVAKKIRLVMGKQNVLSVNIPKFLPDLIAKASSGIAKFTERAPLLNQQKINEIRQPYWTIQPQKAIQDFGFSPRPLEEGLRDTVEWYQKQKWL